MIARSVLLTWNPNTGILSRSEMEDLIQRVQDDGPLEVPWRCRLLAEPGNAAFLLMQGEKPPRIFGIGEIVGMRYVDESGTARIPVVWKQVVPPFDGIDAKSILTENERNTRRSGLSYLSDVSASRTIVAWRTMGDSALDLPKSDGEKDYAGREIRRMAKHRIAQAKFAHEVKENYGYRCCVCGLSSRVFIVGAHISRWSDNASSRLDPANGLSLCVLHDKAFEYGYWTLSDDYTVTVSHKCDDGLRLSLDLTEGSKIQLPCKAAPAIRYIQEHRGRFLGSMAAGSAEVRTAKTVKKKATKKKK